MRTINTQLEDNELSKLGVDEEEAPAPRDDSAPEIPLVSPDVAEPTVGVVVEDSEPGGGLVGAPAVVPPPPADGPGPVMVDVSVTCCCWIGVQVPNLFWYVPDGQ